MRLLIIDHYGGVSGGQRSVLQLIIYARNQGCWVGVACPSKGGFAKLVTEAGACIFPVEFNKNNTDPTQEGRINRRPLLLLSYVPRVIVSILNVRTIAKAHSVDVIYGNSFKAGIIGAILCTVLKIPLVMRLRTSRDYSNHGWFDKYVCKKAELLLANSAYVAKTFESVVDDRHKVQVVYNHGGLKNDYAPNRDIHRIQLRSKLNISEDSIVFGQVGRLMPRKRIMDVVMAAYYFSQQYTNFRCVFIGEYESNRESRAVYIQAVQLVNKLEMSDKIIFMGNRDDALNLVNGFDAMVLASQDEPMARVIIEALGIGVPIIASQDSGNSEIIIDNVNGLTYTLGDSRLLSERLVALHRDAQLRDTLVERGYITYHKHFTKDSTVRREMDLIRSVAKNVLNIQ